MIPLEQYDPIQQVCRGGIGDFKGKWTSDFTGIQQLYNIYTGAYGGMHVNQSNEEFVFSGNTYNWKLLVVKRHGGASQFNQVKSSGTFSIPNNWQLQCSKIENGPKLYNAFWSCIKGAGYWTCWMRNIPARAFIPSMALPNKKYIQNKNNPLCVQWFFWLITAAFIGSTKTDVFLKLIDAGGQQIKRRYHAKGYEKV